MADLLADYVDLTEEAERLVARQDEIKRQLENLQSAILEDWADRGQTQAKLNGRTVFIRHDFYCSKKGEATTTQVCEILKTNGLGTMVAEGYNAQSLKARVKEWAEEGQVPDDLAAVLNFDTVARLSTRRS